MNYSKALIISRYHDDLANPIYNAYIRGIQSQCGIIRFIDYFDQIGALGKRGFERQVEHLIEKEGINLIFFIFVSGDPTLDPHFIQRIAQNRFIAMVFWDTEQFFEQIDRYYAQLADLVILPANYEYEYLLNSMGVNAVCPFSLFDSSKYKPDSMSRRKTVDVSFVGEVTKGKRQEYIDYLISHGINIETYGAGTKNGKVSFERVVEIFNVSKINLSFTGTYANSVYPFGFNIHDRIKQNKGKPIEIALCGGFVLTEYVPGIERVFDKEMIDSFHTKEELLQKIRHYLEYEDEREAMASNAHLHAREHYDSIYAFASIFKTIRSITPKPAKELILDPVFCKIHSTFQLFYAIEFLYQYRFKDAWEEIKTAFRYKTFYPKDVGYFLQFRIRNSLHHLWTKFIQKKSFFSETSALLKTLKTKKIVIYGAGYHTRALFRHFPELTALNIVLIIDKDKNLHGQSIHAIPIGDPSQLSGMDCDILISSYAFEREIFQNLTRSYPHDKIHMLYNGKYPLPIIYAARGSKTLFTRHRTDPYQIYRHILAKPK